MNVEPHNINIAQRCDISERLRIGIVLMLTLILKVLVLGDLINTLSIFDTRGRAGMIFMDKRL